MKKQKKSNPKLKNATEALKRKYLEKKARQENEKLYKEQLEQLERIEYIQKINVFNQKLAQFYAHTPLIRKLVLSSLVIDLLLFLIDSSIFQAIPGTFVIGAQKVLAYVLLITASFVFFYPAVRNIFASKTAGLNKGIISLLIIFLIMIGVAAYEIFRLSENQDWGNLLIQIAIAIGALWPLAEAIRKAAKNPNSPNWTNLVNFLTFLAPICVSRVLTFLYAFTCVILGSGFLNWLIFALGACLIILSVKPLIPLDHRFNVKRVIF